MNEELKNELLARLDKARTLEKRITELQRAEEKLRLLVESGHAVSIKIKQAVSFDESAWVELKASASGLDGLEASDLREALTMLHTKVAAKLQKLQQEYEEL